MRLFSSDSFNTGMVRDYAIAGAMILMLSVFGIHQFNAFMVSMQQGVRTQTATLERKEPQVRNYSVTRSVLDDTVATGSISNRPIILDPCTGQVKSR